MTRVVNAFEPGYGPVCGLLGVFELGLRAEISMTLGDWEDWDELDQEGWE